MRLSVLRMLTDCLSCTVMRLSVCLSVCLEVSWVCLSVCLAVLMRLSIYLSVCLCLSVEKLLRRPEAVWPSVHFVTLLWSSVKLCRDQIYHISSSRDVRLSNLRKHYAIVTHADRDASWVGTLNGACRSVCLSVRWLYCLFIYVVIFQSGWFYDDHTLHWFFFFLLIRFYITYKH